MSIKTVQELHDEVSCLQCVYYDIRHTSKKLQAQDGSSTGQKMVSFAPGCSEIGGSE